MLRVADLRVELKAVELPVRVLERGDRRPVGRGGHAKAGRRFHNGIAMVHPDDLPRVEAGEQLGVGGEGGDRAAVLATGRPADLSPPVCAIHCIP